MYEECPYSVDAKTLLYKGLLNKVEEVSPATKIRFVKGYLTQVREQEAQADGGRCVRCGYPSYAEVCNFCRLFERFGIGEGLHIESYEPASLSGTDEASRGAGSV